MESFHSSLDADLFQIISEILDAVSSGQGQLVELTVCNIAG